MRSGGDRSANHTALVEEILLELGRRPDCRVWHQKALTARVGRQYVVTGLVGMADISGVLAGGRRLEIEVKTGGATLQQAQRSWRDMIVRFGGVHLIAHSVDEAVAGVEFALRGRA